MITLVDQILAAKKQHTPQSPLDRGELQPPVSPFVKGELKGVDTSALDPVRNLIEGHMQGDSPVISNGVERQIDEMVYKLYGLTDDEIAIVEGKG